MFRGNGWDAYYLQINTPNLYFSATTKLVGTSMHKGFGSGRGGEQFGKQFLPLASNKLFYTPQTFFLLTNLAAIVDFGFQFLPNK